MKWYEKVVGKYILRRFLMLDFLKGYRTYIIAVLVGVLTAVYQLNYIDLDTYQIVLGWLGAAGLATLRAGIGRSNP